MTLVGVAVGASIALGALTLAMRRRLAKRSAVQETSTPTETASAGGDYFEANDALLYGSESLWLAGSLHIGSADSRLGLFHCPGHAKSPWLLETRGTFPEIVMLQALPHFPSGSVPRQWQQARRSYRFERTVEGSFALSGVIDLPETTKGSLDILASACGRRVVVLRSAGQTLLALEGPSIERHQVTRLPGETKKPRSPTD